MTKKTKLHKGDKVTMDMVDQFLGVPPIYKRVIPFDDSIAVVDLQEDMLYLLEKVGKRDFKTLYRVDSVVVWSRVVEMIRRGFF